MKQFSFLFGLFFFLFYSEKTFASHMAGGEITYRCEGNGIYAVVVKVYRDCSGIQLDSSGLTAKCGSNIVKTTLSLLSVRDVTGYGENCNKLSRCSGGSGPGIQEFTLQGTIDLSAYNCCEWILSWAQEVRTGLITTGMAHNPFYVESKLNKCLSPCNSSPVFRETPKFVISHNKDFSCFIGAEDTIDGDSLSYHLVPAMQYENVDVVYGSDFSYLKPLTFWGWPNSSLPYPLGFRLDSITGLLAFRPTNSTQIAVMVVEVKEWRLINGVMENIGSVKRDFQLSVMKYTNEIPSFQGFSRQFYACAGSHQCFNIESVDQDANDTTGLEIRFDIPGASIDTTVGTTQRPITRLCWTPQLTDVRAKPYMVYASVKDNACPLPGERNDIFFIYVTEPGTDTFSVTSNGCGQVALSAKPGKAPTGGGRFWRASDTSGQVTTISYNLIDTVYLPAGKYKILFETSSPSFCQKYFEDSITVNSVLPVKLGPDTAICRGNSVVLDAGTGATSYQWNTGDTAQSITVSESGTYTVEKEDLNSCLSTDSISIQVNELPDSSFTVQDHTNRNFTFSATDNTLKYIWDFGDGNFAYSNPATWQYASSATYQVVLNVTDTISGCTNTGSQTLVITDVAELEQSNLKAYLYPNPVADVLSVNMELPLEGNLSFIILDINGKEVTKEAGVRCKAGECSKSINTAELASGFYTLKIQFNDKTSAVLKFVKR